MLEDVRVGGGQVECQIRRSKTDQLGRGKCLIWILGHSFVFWGARRAEVRQNGWQMGLDALKRLFGGLVFGEYPGLIVVWSDILTRLAWRGDRSVDKVNKARAQVNRVVALFMTRNGGLVVRHRELEPATWQFRRGDGVHLNDIGADLWALGLQDGVERAFGVWRIQAT
ncbi:uncharacterized protein ACNLHF_009390 [Anomaloglossus baeobatrachus]